MRWMWILLTLLIAAAGWYFYASVPRETPVPQGGTAGETISNGVITFARPADFGLAVTPEQILVRSYIPPCDEGFDYCLYYNGSTYAGTNFESAGLSIRKRPDLVDTTSCLSAQPSGYNHVPIKTLEKESYSISVAQVGEGAAGHIATGEEYRLFTAGKCYQLDTRVGESQFANYPAGAIQEFSKEDRDGLILLLRSLVGATMLSATGQRLQLPQ